MIHPEQLHPAGQVPINVFCCSPFHPNSWLYAVHQNRHCVHHSFPHSLIITVHHIFPHYYLCTVHHELSLFVVHHNPSLCTSTANHHYVLSTTNHHYVHPPQTIIMYCPLQNHHYVLSTTNHHYVLSTANHHYVLSTTTHHLFSVYCPPSLLVVHHSPLCSLHDKL